MATGYTNKDNNPFYNEVSQEVKDELDARANIYGKQARGGNDNAYIHSWLYRKTAFVKVLYNDGKGDKEILEPPKAGFKDMYGDGLYPPAVVTAVNISNEGDYGSLMKAEIHFSVYTLNQLESFLKTLLRVKAGDKGEPPVTIEYGWSINGRNGPEEKLYGVVTNFNWTLRPDGGFDCISYIIAAGFFSLNTNVDATVGTRNGSSPIGTTISGNSYKSPESPIDIKPATWLDTLPMLTWGGNEEARGFSDYTLDSGNGIALIELVAKRESEDTTLAKLPITYATLEWICMAISKTIQYNSPNFANPSESALYIANKDITVSWKYPDLVSADPKNIIFPGYSTYGDKDLCGDIKITMNSGDTADLSKILVSVDFMKEVLASQQSDLSMRMNGKDVDKSVGTFLNSIFTKISECSGGIYNLTLATPSIAYNTDNTQFKQSLNSWMILDTNYIGAASFEPKIIPVIKTKPGDSENQSIVRSVSLTSKLPGALATAQYVAAMNTLTGHMPVIDGVTEEATNKASPEAKQNVKDIATKLSKNGFVSTDANDLASALREFKIYGDDSKTYKDKGWARGAPIPVELSLTMDGIKGFRVGNTITIGYLPADYKNVVFTVTKIQHTIQNNDWTTTLTTVCRLKV